MNIQLARTDQIPSVQSFFQKHLAREMEGIYSDEFVCPLGVSAAVRRQQMLVAVVNGEIVGAIRFYPKKTVQKVSLYQFAIDERFRGSGLLQQMLTQCGDAPIHVLCPSDSCFNTFYKKAGFQLREQGNEFNEWVYTKIGGRQIYAGLQR